MKSIILTSLFKFCKDKISIRIFLNLNILSGFDIIPVCGTFSDLNNSNIDKKVVDIDKDKYKVD